MDCGEWTVECGQYVQLCQLDAVLWMSMSREGPVGTTGPTGTSDPVCGGVGVTAGRSFGIDWGSGLRSV